MKIKSLLFGMLACTALVGCSNEDDPVVNNGSEETLANSYMAIRIADANNVTSRGEGGAYDEGVDAERKIVDADFFFYAGDGRFVALVEKNFTNQTQSAGNVSDKAQMLVLEKTQLQPETLVTLVNNPIAANTLRGLTLSEMKAKVAEIGEIADFAKGNSFFMTCSSYFNGDNAVYGTSVKGLLKESAEEAEDAPVDIYVERVAAKASVKFTKSSSVIPSQIVDETPQEITVRLKGWGLNGTNKDAYLIKSLVGVNYDWAKSSDYRSFWAVDNNYSNGEYATIYKDLLTVGEDGKYSDTDANGNYNSAAVDESEFSLNYISANEASLESEASSYCLENTSDVLLVHNQANPYTTVTIIAEVLLEGNESAETIYKYQGAYYTESSMKNLALNLLKDYKKNGEDLVAADIKFVDAWDNMNNKVKFEVVAGVYTKGEAEVEISEMNGKLQNLGTASCFTNGLCYYNVPIEHFGATSEVENNGVYGMVRNHSYVLNVKSINNVGEAVYKPDAPIIPTITPTPQDFYLSTTLNVLSWKTVSQDVDL